MTAPDALLALAERLRANADALGSPMVRAALGPTDDAIADLRAAADTLLAAREERDAARRDFEAAELARARLQVEVANWEGSFDLYFRALMRGTALWRAAHPGNDLVEPDTGELVAWLLERTERVVSDPVPALLLWWADYLSGVCDGCDLAEDTHATLWVQDLRHLVLGLRAAAGQEPPKEGTT